LSRPTSILGRAILKIEQPFHPVGLAGAGAEDDGLALATVTADELAAERKNPWDPAYQETTLGCVHVILGEEWEHHRYAVRDLDAIEAEPDA
jgi:hypothetical protein